LEPLEPGEPPRLTLERRALPATTAAAARIPAHDEWVVEGKDGDGDDAFTVAYDAPTGTLLRLFWFARGTAQSHPQAPTSGARAQTEGAEVTEGADEASGRRGRDLLDPARAVAATCHVLHQLGIPQADGPWTVLAVYRGFPSPGPAAKGWRVSLASRRWLVKATLNTNSAQLLQISLLSAREHHDGQVVVFQTYFVEGAPAFPTASNRLLFNNNEAI
jgi:hypothetical protein